MKLKDKSKVNIGFYPTPLHKLSRLSSLTGKADMYIKRDDMTGIGGGGNKLRKLEYIVKEAIDAGCNTLLTYGGVQTNHGRLTAAVAGMNGMKSVIICFGPIPERMSGNLVLDRMFGAELVFMDTTEILKLPQDQMVEAFYKMKDESTSQVLEKYNVQGDKVFEIPMGGLSPAGTLGYFYAVKEIMQQCKEQKINPEYLVVSNGTGGTYAGLFLGAKYYNAPFKIKAISVAPLQEDAQQTLSNFINDVSKEFELGIKCDASDIDLSADYYGDGYNIPDAITRKAVYRLAETEGVIVDPCYTGKGFRGFLDMVEREVIPAQSSAIFLHTGGVPGIWTEEHNEAMRNDLW
ncbi:MAG: pyridoxal-phosphate dependent enzyme [Spirochaetales bacterium]|nr:pyridoxal-phosphate dependent enzyme [Spirochaetales bacterium]